MDRAVLEGILVNETIEVLCEFARHFGRATRTRAIHQARRSLLGKALYPFAQRRIRKVQGRGDGLDVVAGDDLTDGLCAAKDTGLLGLLEHGV
jgi:hypothetical protein